MSEEITIQVCGGSHALMPARHWEKEIFDQGEACHCCKKYQPRVLMDDGDILEIACLCGYRSFSDQDGYSDRSWGVDSTARLFCMDKQGQAHLHIFKDMYGGKSLCEQMDDFSKEFDAELPIMLPLNSLPGISDTLVATSLKMVELFYGDYETDIAICHHYSPALDSDDEYHQKLYEQDMRDQDKDRS